MNAGVDATDCLLVARAIPDPAAVAMLPCPPDDARLVEAEPDEIKYEITIKCPMQGCSPAPMMGMGRMRPAPTQPSKMTGPTIPPIYVIQLNLTGVYSAISHTTLTHLACNFYSSVLKCECTGVFWQQ
jgi:hypothetical protein